MFSRHIFTRPRINRCNWPTAREIGIHQKGETMKSFRMLSSTIASILVAGAATAATLVIPASGTGPGANNSHWATDVTLHNSGVRPIAATITFHDQNGAAGKITETIAPHGTESIADIVKSRFAKESATGALVIDVEDLLAGRLAVTSRTYNRSEQGDLGQDIPAIKIADSLSIGDTGVIIAPSTVENFRFNFGVYALEASSIHWQVLRADGTVAAQRDVDYAAGEQQQYNSGVKLFLGADPQANDVVYAVIRSGRALVYGSAIDQGTGDPTFVPGTRTKQDISLDFVGVDVNQDGIADVLDSDRDGVVDEPIDVYKTVFANIFRLIANSPDGSAVKFTLLDNPDDAVMLDQAGVIEVFPSGTRQGQTATLRVLATTSSSSTVLLIPIRYR
jgi:hypothetical protein